MTTFAACLVCTLLQPVADRPLAAVPAFTDSAIEGAVAVGPARSQLPLTGGTRGVGLDAGEGLALENPLLTRRAGLMTFWIRPQWDGDDGERHRILTIGDPGSNGLSLEKAPSGVLRLLMASPERRTVARADISRWRRGEWHHIAIGWMTRNGLATGLPLWIDRVCVDGPVPAGNPLMDPDAMEDARVIVGGESCDATIDELILRDRFDTEGWEQICTVYRDYFRGAPYDAIEIDREPCRVPADARVVAGHPKQFGLLARLAGTWEPVTDYTVRYGNWSEFDAKPFIEWRVSDPGTATVDGTGRVVGVAPGWFELTATYLGMEDTIRVEVIPVELPDLDVTYVSRLPRYPADEPKVMPSAGERVASVVHLHNAGFATVPAGVEVRWEILPERTEDFVLTSDEGRVGVRERWLDQPLPPGATTTIEFPWTWPEEPHWIRVTVDPDDMVTELCEANNEVTELNTARPLWFGYDRSFLRSVHTERKMTLVGSFSYYDYIRAQKLRMDRMLREAVLPETSPVGVRDAYRIDLMYAMAATEEELPEEAQERWYDGGFPVGSHAELMNQDSGLIHEFGHTCLALPDLYGYGVRPYNVLLRDASGQPIAGSALLPEIRQDTLPYSSANTVPCGVGYVPLMDFCHLWLHPANAGKVDHFRGYRGPRFWGTQGRLIPPLGTTLVVTDIEDQPLKGAAVYVYHVTQTGALDAWSKFIADRPKFVGHTDRFGRFEFPNQTDEEWDDADTDEVDGAIQVWNPFGRVKTDTAFTPNVWTVEGLLLVRIDSGEQTEFHWLSLTDFNQAFFRSRMPAGTIPIATSLEPHAGETPVVRPPIPPAVRETNLAPVAVVDRTELTVVPGEAFTVDGSASYDPERQPLYYRWVGDRLSTEAKLTVTAPDSPRELEYRFYVLDGVRASEPVTVSVHVVAPET